MKSPPFSDKLCTTSPNGPKLGAAEALADGDAALAGTTEALGVADAALGAAATLLDAGGTASGLAGSHEARSAVRSVATVKVRMAEGVQRRMAA
ncbi:MAG: hypothetical protein IPM54_07685 [Polyangiaceae bacterium]|nr:hypothetical protein [Polyangiaceae bacterium]